MSTVYGDIELKKGLQGLERVRNAQVPRLGYLRLDKNENLVPMPPKLLATLRKQLTSDFISAYPETDVLYTKLAKYLGCSTKNLYLSAGSDGAIKSVFEAFVSPLDTVLLVSPTYAMFYVYAKMFEVQLKEIFYQQDLTLSSDKIIEAINTLKPKLVCIANPNSPTGTIIEPRELEKIIEVASQDNAIMLIDEAYYPFYSKTCLPLIPKYPNLIITRTFSKAFGLASGRLGFAVGGEDIIGCLFKTRPMYEANAFAIRFAEIILDNKTFIKRNLEESKKGKKFLETSLRKLGVKFFETHANFINIDVGSRERAVAITQALYQKKIIIKSDFGAPLQNCIRINFGTVKQMKTFIHHFKGALR